MVNFCLNIFSRYREKIQSQKAFTLVELLLVMVIIALLIYLFVNGYTLFRRNTYFSETVTNLILDLNLVVKDAQTNKIYNTSIVNSKYVFSVDTANNIWKYSQCNDNNSSCTEVKIDSPSGDFGLKTNCNFIDISVLNSKFTIAGGNSYCCIQVFDNQDNNYFQNIYVDAISKDIKILNSSENSLCSY